MKTFALNASKKTKSTPAGEIPVDWGTARLADVAIIKSGGTPERNVPAYWKGTIPWIKTGEIDFNTITETSESITQAGLEASSAWIAPRGSVLMAMYGQGKTRGQVAILGIDAALNQACAAIQPNPERLDAAYLFFNLQSRYKEIRHLSNSGSQENLSGQVIRAITIPLPPLSEQRRITAIICMWDEALEKLGALIKAKELNRKALSQRLLTRRTRLKGFTGAWTRVTLGELAENVADQNKGRMGAASLYGVTKSGGVVPMREHVKGESFARCKRVEPDWFAYNPMRINIGSIARWQGAEAVMVSGDYVVFRCNEKLLLPAYLDHLRRSWMWETFVTRGGNGSVRVRIYFTDLGEFAFLRPPIEEQAAIATILDACEEELRLLRLQRVAVDRQKRGLMQRILTGKIRV